MTPHDSIPLMLGFLDRVGIPYCFEPVGESFLPGITVRYGTVVIDPTIPYPGDILHDAGHVAMTDPAFRNTIESIPPNAALEMTTIAWSYAAAKEIDLDLDILFHTHGYSGGGEYLPDAFLCATPPGVPMLQYYGMTAEPKNADRLGLPAFPKMARWLR